jgi:hypothetical protein
MPPINKATDAQRLLQKIDQLGPDDCWLWKGGIGTWGYGSFFLNAKTINASRAAYILLVGPLDDEQVVCHSCDSPPCCNPRHLWSGTQAENLDDCRKKNRSRNQLEANGYEGHPRYNAKLTPEMIRSARELYAAGMTQVELGRKFGVHSSVMSRAIRGLNWRHIK